jgi:DNA polymerase III epsilon subunit-like protein
MRTTEWVLIDTETSGLRQPIHCIELAAQRMKGTTRDGPAFRALLNHEVDIDPQAEAVHGYSRSFLRANGRNPIEVHREFNAYAGTRPVVAYNLSFDWGRVLEPELKRLGMSPAYSPGFCALTLARRCVHESSSHKLDALRGVFFPTHTGRSHHALDDVEITNRLILEVIWPRLERAGIHSFSGVAAFSRQTPVRECIERILNPAPTTTAFATSVQDPESELFSIIEGMLADEQIVDAEVWSLKHWLDAHAQHQSELAARSRRLLDKAFADGQLSSWELDDIRLQLRRLIAVESRPERTGFTPAISGPESKNEKKRRLSLTKRQLDEEVGAALLALLERIVADGSLSDEEIKDLTDWLLQNQGGDLPAIEHLIDVVKDIVADGKITDSERVDLFLGIEKVLPVTERRVAKAAREDAEARAIVNRQPKIGRDELKEMIEEPRAPAHERSWRGDPMTEAQNAFIRSLGGSIRANASKGEASQLIDTLLGNKPITSRQQMVMRFWARERQPGEGPREISEWMDQFYQEDGDRKVAWELFKNESDNGLQGDPSRVPLGVGPEYLRRIKLGGRDAVPRFRSSPPTPVITPTSVEVTESRTSRTPYVLGAAVGLLAIVLVIGFVTKKPSQPETSSITEPTPTTAKVAPSPKASTMPSALPAAKKSGSALRAAVTGLRVTGIIGGPNPRAIIDGQMYRTGDIVDPQRGYRITKIDADKRSIDFTDQENNTATRILD